MYKSAHSHGSGAAAPPDALKQTLNPPLKLNSAPFPHVVAADRARLGAFGDADKRYPAGLGEHIDIGPGSMSAVCDRNRTLRSHLALRGDFHDERSITRRDRAGTAVIRHGHLARRRPSARSQNQTRIHPGSKEGMKR
jgi:hypothetical protein